MVDGVPFPEHSLRRCRHLPLEPLSSMYVWIVVYVPHRIITLPPVEVSPAALQQAVSGRVKATLFSLVLLFWQCLSPPLKLCSALAHSHTQLCLTSHNLSVCAVDPCRIPSVLSLLDFVLAKNPAQASQN